MNTRTFEINQMISTEYRGIQLRNAIKSSGNRRSTHTSRWGWSPLCPSQSRHSTCQGAFAPISAERLSMSAMKCGHPQSSIWWGHHERVSSKLLRGWFKVVVLDWFSWCDAVYGTVTPNVQRESVTHYSFHNWTLYFSIFKLGKFGSHHGHNIPQRKKLIITEF